MKLYKLYNLILLGCFITACKAGNKTADTKSSDTIDSLISINVATTDTLIKGKVIAKVFCEADKDQSYALYIPVLGNIETLPVIYFFDPHGDGTLPLNKYKALADSFGFVFIGSNNSKNGNSWPETENIWATLLNDTKKRLRVNANRMYTCGFSGGAKVATYIGLHNNEIKAVIANGAALPETSQPRTLPFSFTAIAGEGDMNRSDLIEIDKALDNTQSKHRIIFFDGIHEWAPQNIMKIAFAGFQFDAMAKKSIPVDRVFINSFIADRKKDIDDLTKFNRFIRAEELCILTINMLTGLTADVQWFQQKLTSIQANPSYKDQLKTEQALLEKEEKMKQVFEQQFQQGDMNYWTKTIADVKAKASVKNTETAMYQRLQAYLSLAFYSISNQMINSQHNDAAVWYVDLYKKTDPTNSEAWYFSAMLNARSNNASATKSDLLKAVGYGFNDKARLAKQPEFKQLGATFNLTEITAQIN